MKKHYTSLLSREAATATPRLCGGVAPQKPKPAELRSYDCLRLHEGKNMPHLPPVLIVLNLASNLSIVHVARPGRTQLERVVRASTRTLLDRGTF